MCATIYCFVAADSETTHRSVRPRRGAGHRETAALPLSSVPVPVPVRRAGISRITAATRAGYLYGLCGATSQLLALNVGARLEYLYVLACGLWQESTTAPPIRSIITLDRRKVTSPSAIVIAALLVLLASSNTYHEILTVLPRVA